MKKEGKWQGNGGRKEERIEWRVDGTKRRRS